jgi:hypothetical protein
MDKILFPYRGYPAFPPRSVIYPDKKSSLENLLDHFFFEEGRPAGRSRLPPYPPVPGLAGFSISTDPPDWLGLGLDKSSAPGFRLDPPPDRYHPQHFKDGQLEPHSSWDQAILKAWEDSAAEPFQTMQRQPIPLMIDPSWSPLERRRRVTAAVAGALRIYSGLRRSLVDWDFGNSDGNGLLVEAVEWLWDGMRRLPYTETQIATAIGVCAQLASLGLSADTEWERQSKIASELFGPAIPIEFGGPDGSYSRAFTAERDLRAAMRDDLLELTEERFRDRFDTTTRILVDVTNPQRLFDFKRLCALFAEQIVSWQVLTRRGRVVFFAPSSTHEPRPSLNQ